MKPQLRLPAAPVRAIAIHEALGAASLNFSRRTKFVNLRVEGGAFNLRSRAGRLSYFCWMTLSRSIGGWSLFWVAPPGQMISTLSTLVALLRPIVTGNSDCDR